MSDGKWLPWHGDRPFRGDKPLRVKFRCGKVSKEVLPARKWRGEWLGSPYDIVAVEVQSAD